MYTINNHCQQAADDRVCAEGANCMCISQKNFELLIVDLLLPKWPLVWSLCQPVF